MLPIEVLNIIFGYLPEKYGKIAHKLEPSIRPGINSYSACDEKLPVKNGFERLIWYEENANGPITRFKYLYSIWYNTFREGESISEKILEGIPAFVYKKLNLQNVCIRGHGDFNMDIMPESLNEFELMSLSDESLITGTPDKFRNIQRLTLHDINIAMNLSAFRNLRVLSLRNNGDVKLPSGLRSLTCDSTTNAKAIPTSVKYLRYEYHAPFMYTSRPDPIKLNLKHVTSLRYLKVWAECKIEDFHVSDQLKKISLRYHPKIEFNENFPTDQLKLIKLKLMHCIRQDDLKKFGSLQSLQCLYIDECSSDFNFNAYPNLHHLTVDTGFDYIQFDECADLKYVKLPNNYTYKFRKSDIPPSVIVLRGAKSLIPRVVAKDRIFRWHKKSLFASYSSYEKF